MNFQTTIVLLVLLVAVGAWVFLVESGREPQYERDRRATEEGQIAGTPLFPGGDSFSDDVTGFTIETSDGTADFAKEGNDWWQVEPVRFKLTSWNAGNIPTDMGKLRSVRRFSPGNDSKPSLEKIDLDPAALATVTLEAVNNGTTQRHTIKLGRKSISGVAYAMLKGDDKVHVVNDDLHDRIIDKDFSAWRDKSISGPKEGQVDQIVLTDNGTAITLAKADGGWAFGAPHSGRADRSAVESHLNDIDGFYIKQFVVDQPSNLAAYGLDRPTYTLRIRKPSVPVAKPADETPAESTDTPGGQDGSTPPTFYTLTIGGPTDMTGEAFFATWAVANDGHDVVFTLGKSSVEGLQKNLDDFRDARITPLQADDVRQVRIERADGSSIHLLQTEGRWHFETPSNPGYDADGGSVQDLVDAIVTAKATGYVADAAATGAATAVTLGALARSEPDVLRILSTDDDTQWLVLRNHETTGYLIAREDVDGIHAPAVALRDRQVLALDAEQIHQVTLRHPGGTQFTFSRNLPEAATSQPSDGATTQPGPWSLAGKEAFDTATLDTLISTLAQLRAEAWTPAADGPGDETLQFEVHAGDNGIVKMALTPASRLATLEGIDTPFTLSKSTVEKLNAELRDRTVLPITTLDVDSITVTRGETIYTLLRDADDAFVDAGGAAIDQSVAGGLFDTLAGLRVQRYVAATAPETPAMTLTVTTKSGGTHTLLIADLDDPQHTVHVDGRGCRLSEDVFGKLVANLVKADGDA